MDAKQLWDFVRFLANKAQYGSISPDEFNLAWNRAELELFNKMRPIAEVTHQYEDELRHLKKESVISPVSGILTLPDDYGYFSALSWLKSRYSEATVDVLRDNEWAERTTSKLIPVDRNPIARFISKTQIQIVPVNTRVRLKYYRVPTPGVFAYTANATGTIITYDQAGSVASEFPETMMNQVAMKICSYWGINLEKYDLLEYTNGN